MSARAMYDAMNFKAPAGKEAHHGNKRKQLATLKKKARKADRAKLKSTTRSIEE